MHFNHQNSAYTCSLAMRIFQLTLALTAIFFINPRAPLNARTPENFQPGYIIIADDTIKGFILIDDHSLNLKQCTFKETAEGQVRIYSPNDVTGYGVDDKSFYYAATLPDNSNDTKVFLSCIVKNNVSLFSYRNRFFIKAENRIEELTEVKIQVTRNGKTFNEKRPLYKSVLQNRMNDCSTIHEKLANTTLTEYSLVNLFIDYATCTGNDAIVFDQANIKTNRSRYGFSAGLLAADLKLKAGANSRYSFGENASGDRSLTFTPSFFMEFDLSKKFALRTGINWYYTKNHLVAKSTATNLTNNFFLEISRIEVPLILSYSLSKGAVKWSLKGGIGLDGIIKYEDRLIVSTTTSGFVLSEYRNDLKKNSLLLNGMIGAGTEFLLGNRSFVVEGYYNRSGSLVQSAVHAHLEGFKFSVGMFL